MTFEGGGGGGGCGWLGDTALAGGSCTGTEGGGPEGLVFRAGRCLGLCPVEFANDWLIMEDICLTVPNLLAELPSGLCGDGDLGLFMLCALLMGLLFLFWGGAGLPVW